MNVQDHPVRIWIGTLLMAAAAFALLLAGAPAHAFDDADGARAESQRTGFPLVRSRLDRGSFEGLPAYERGVGAARRRARVEGA